MCSRLNVALIHVSLSICTCAEIKMKSYQRFFPPLLLIICNSQPLRPSLRLNHHYSLEIEFSTLTHRRARTRFYLLHCDRFFLSLLKRTQAKSRALSSFTSIEDTGELCLPTACCTSVFWFISRSPGSKASPAYSAFFPFFSRVLPDRLAYCFPEGSSTACLQRR